MPKIEEQKFCSHCVYPFNLGVINLLTGKPLQFSEHNGRLLCEICFDFPSSFYFPIRRHFNQELEDYFNTHSRILFAYSGGLDSTVVLTHLVKECKKRGIKIETFTITTGAKGKMTQRNINNVIAYLKINNHFFIDISQAMQNDPKILAIVGNPMSTLAVYKYCNTINILPCGKICNTIMDETYKSVMRDKGYSELFTGGDTPKIGDDGKYSLFWKKANGIVIVRGGYAFNLSKEKNRQFVEKNNIPWTYINYGGYDTDCLIPGVFFANVLQGNQEVSLSELVHQYPIILEYLAERVRFGIIERKRGLKMLTHIDIASPSCCAELEKIFQVVI